MPYEQSACACTIYAPAFSPLTAHFDFTRGGGNRVFLVIFVDFFDKVVCAHRFEVLERVFVGLFTSGANDVQFFRHFVVQYRFVFEVLVGDGKKRYAYESDDEHYEYGL